MNWTRDTTGRFARRPYYEREELDHECEGIVAAFLRRRNGEASYPITTNDLTILVETEAGDLDLYADLSGEGETVEGMTEFFPGRGQRVSIAAELALPGRENRLRTTLTHELGHVKFHGILWATDFTQASLFGYEPAPGTPKCRRDAIIGASMSDWLEWQAGYASGAFLMPIGAIRRVVGAVLEASNAYGAIELGSPVGRELIRRVQSSFQVSADAARVRLNYLGHIADRPAGPDLFNLSTG